MTADRYQLLATPGFRADLERLRNAAAYEHQRFPDLRDHTQKVHRTRYVETLREIDRLRTGASNGHHALGQSKGFGDGRDAVASRIWCGPQMPTDRLIFREIPARNTDGAFDARELLVIGPRRGQDNAYRTAAVRLGRDPDRRVADLDRFGAIQISSGGKAHRRTALLDAQRAIAHAYDGQRPLTGSRPLIGTDSGSRPISQRATTIERLNSRTR